MVTTKQRENLVLRTPKSSTFKKSLRNAHHKSQKISRITTNGYLNYLREFKKQFSGLSPQDMVHFGAIEWNKLSMEDKISYKNMVTVCFYLTDFRKEFIFFFLEQDWRGHENK